MGSIKTTQVVGDVSVGRNVSLGGKATVAGSVVVGHDVRVSGWLDAPNVKGALKGVFLSLADLNSAYSTPEAGWLAGVGTSSPFAAYVGKGGKWVSTGGTITIEVDMSPYSSLAERVSTLEAGANRDAGRLSSLETFRDTTQPVRDSAQDAAIALKADSASVYTRTELDTALALKADEADYYDKLASDERYLIVTDMEQQCSHMFDNTLLVWSGVQPRGSVAEYGSGSTWQLLLFAVSRGEEWVVRRAAGVNGGTVLLCALYDCDSVTSVVGCTDAGHVVPNTLGPSMSDTSGAEVRYEIPLGAKWLVVTKYKSDTLTVCRVSRENAGVAVSRIDGCDAEQNVRLAAVEAKNVEQDSRLDVVESKNTEQDGRLAAVESKNVEQDGRLANAESGSALHDYRLSLLESVGLMSDYSERQADYTLPGYGIAKSTGAAYAGGDLFELRGYRVSPGSRCRIVAPASKASSSWARVYAFYAIDALQSGDAILVSGSSMVSHADEQVRVWKSVDVDDTVVVPSGATMLVVTVVKSLESSMLVQSDSPVGATSLFPRVAALEGIAESVKFVADDGNELSNASLDGRLSVVESSDMSQGGRLTAIEDVLFTGGGGYAGREPEDTGIDYTVREGGTGYAIGSRGIAAEAWAGSSATVYGYRLIVYAVSPGERWRIVRTVGAGTSGTKSWAFYNAQDAQHILDGKLVSVAPVDTRQVGEWEVDVPDGANMLVLSDISTIAAPYALKWVKLSLADKQSALEQGIASLRESESLHDTIGRLAVERRGEYVCVSCNRGDGTELCYRFTRCFTAGNNTMGWANTGFRSTDRRHASTADVYNWRDITRLQFGNQTDVVGPTSYDGYSDFVGGAHALHYASGVSASTTPTAQTLSWQVLADGVELADGGSLTCGEVVFTVVNAIRRPADGVVNTAGYVAQAQTWDDLVPFCQETQVITIKADGTVTVRVKHAFATESAGKTIAAYYGMQSTFYGDRLLTVGGPYRTLTPVASVGSFGKASAPNFSRFIEVNDEIGWCQSAWLRQDVGIGDHSLVKDDTVFVTGGNARASKHYHRVVGGVGITQGMEYEWEGVYSWFKNDSALMPSAEQASLAVSALAATDITSATAAAGVVSGATLRAHFYTKTEIDALLDGLRNS